VTAAHHTPTLDFDTMTAGRELDALVAEKVMGVVWRKVGVNGVVKATLDPLGYYSQHEECRPDFPRWSDYCRDVPAYSTDIAAAWQVVEHMATNHYRWWEMARRPFKDGLGALVNFTGDPKDSCVAPTVPLAICLAALKAVGAEVPA
jgi:hypothetical protein